jgi:hypothetical protein
MYYLQFNDTFPTAMFVSVASSRKVTVTDELGREPEKTDENPVIFKNIHSG